MATVKIWAVKNNLHRVIDYTEDKNKTKSDNSDLQDALDYIKADEKTEKQFFVTGVNCNKDTAVEEMKSVKELYAKNNGIIAFHAEQSFKEGEVSPELAHEIGVRLANEMWGDRFQVVVSTHLNTKHVHNHFVINSVSFVDGKKYYANRTSYAELRRINDEICKEFGLSNLKEKKTKSGVNYLNYQKKEIEQNNYYKMAKKDLDIAIDESSSYSEFIDILKKMGYDVYNRSGKLSIKGNNYKRNIRIERYYGEDYSIDNIKLRIHNAYISTNHKVKRSKPQNNLLLTLLHPKYKGFYANYVRYMNILNNYESLFKKTNFSTSIKEDIKNLDKISEEVNLLANNNINTKDDFDLFIKNNEEKLGQLKSIREKINRSKDTTVDKLEDINNDISKINSELKICERIRIRTESINKNLEIIDSKEMNKEYELVK